MVVCTLVDGQAGRQQRSRGGLVILEQLLQHSEQSVRFRVAQQTGQRVRQVEHGPVLDVQTRESKVAQCAGRTVPKALAALLARAEQRAQSVQELL
jgi:hypothetical protein